MPIVSGLDIQRKQISFDYLDTVTGDVRRGQIVSADREHPRPWLARFAGRGYLALALEGCTGWRYVDGELAAAGVAAHVGGTTEARRTACGSHGLCVSQNRSTTNDRQRSLAGSSSRTVSRRNPGASGSVNRLLQPDSVRHMSVTTAMQGSQRHIMTHSGTTAGRPASPGMPRPRAISAGGGRCWVRTNVG
jgi:hypothetical protein